MQMMKILVLPGDGIGPEIVAESIKLLQAADRIFHLNLLFDYEEIGFLSLKKYGTTLRDEVLQKAPAEMHVAIGIEAFGGFAHDDEIHGLGVGKKMARTGGADVGVEIEANAEGRGDIAAAVFWRGIVGVGLRAED